MKEYIHEQWIEVLEWCSHKPEPIFNADERDYLLGLVDKNPEAEALIARLIKQCFLDVVGESKRRMF